MNSEFDLRKGRASIRLAVARLAATVSLVLVCMAVSGATMLGGSDYDLTWHTIDGGGGTSTGGSYALSGTIGQPDAGAMSGGDYVLAGGFWAGGAVTDPTPACPADLTGSGSVGVPDLLALLACWGLVSPGSGCENADLTGSGSIGVPDLLSLLAQWGPCP